jgi:hypothetical protein
VDAPTAPFAKRRISVHGTVADFALPLKFKGGVQRILAVVTMQVCVLPFDWLLYWRVVVYNSNGLIENLMAGGLP